MELTTVLGSIIVAGAAALVLSRYKPEYAFFISLIAGILVFISLLSSITETFFSIRETVLDAGLNTKYFTVVLKTLGICLITGFIADTCRDAGQSALASRAELAGRCAVFIISVPLLKQLLETAAELIG